MDNEKKKRKRGDRRDGVWLRDLDTMHMFMPYVYLNRTDNEAFISERIDLTNIENYLAVRNADNPEEPYKLFHVLLTAMVKTMCLRPRMNRFIKGRRIYQRNELTLAFVVKKKFKDNGSEALAFIKFDGDDTLETVKNKVYAEINECRSDKIDNTTAGMDFGQNTETAAHVRDEDIKSA